jgi:hypothetical protein
MNVRVPIWKHRLFAPACVGGFYIALTWWLLLNWYSDLEIFMTGVMSQLPDDQNAAQTATAIGRAMSDAPQMSLLLRILLIPIPAWVGVDAAGQINFWSVVAQGLIISLLVFWISGRSTRAQR